MKEEQEENDKETRWMKRNSRRTTMSKRKGRMRKKRMETRRRRTTRLRTTRRR